MIRTVLVIARKDLRQRLRDRSAIVLGLVAPLGIAALMSFAFKGTETFHFTLGVVDADHGPVASSVDADPARSPSLRADHHDRGRGLAVGSPRRGAGPEDGGRSRDPGRLLGGRRRWSPAAAHHSHERQQHHCRECRRLDRLVVRGPAQRRPAVGGDRHRSRGTRLAGHTPRGVGGGPAHPRTGGASARSGRTSSRPSATTPPPWPSSSSCSP